jgi:hypothetical protein
MYKKVVLIISLPWKEKGSGLDRLTENSKNGVADLGLRQITNGISEAFIYL